MSKLNGDKMKPLLITLLLVLSILPIQSNATAKKVEKDVFDSIYSLLNKKEYFRFRNLFEGSKENLEEWQVLYFQTLISSLSNKPKLANDYANILFEKYEDILADSIKKEVYTARISNLVHLFDYKGAMIVSEELLELYGEGLDKEKKEEYENALTIWRVAQDVLPQTAEINSDSKIKFINGFAGKNVETTIGGKSFEFIFDTGASFSVMIKSLAQELGLTFFPGEFKVTSATGEKLPAELAVAESIVIGNMTFKNVLFLVFPDEAFTFGPDMVIEGIIGFPIINAMKEIRISGDELFVPKAPLKKGYNNLALDGFSPVIEMIAESDTLCFGFDTGAEMTMLYPPFYEFYKEDVEKNYEIEKYKFGGAGGVIEVDAYGIDTLGLKTGETSALLEGIHLLISPLGESSEYYYGNLGRDFIGQYKTYIINFEDMFIDFER